MHRNLVVILAPVATVTFPRAEAEPACVPESADEKQANSQNDRDRSGLVPAKFDNDKPRHGIGSEKF